jgi:hypothetical protein
VQRDWEVRWRAAYEKSADNRFERGQGPSSEPADAPIFDAKALQKHKGLQRHESSLLTQLRTGKIGLRSFLFSRRVPGVTSPLCGCGQAPETAPHLALTCVDTTEDRLQLQTNLYPMRTMRDFIRATLDKAEAKQLVRWFLALGRLQEYRLAMEIQEEEDQADQQEDDEQYQGRTTSGARGEPASLLLPRRDPPPPLIQ